MRKTIVIVSSALVLACEGKLQPNAETQTATAEAKQNVQKAAAEVQKKSDQAAQEMQKTAAAPRMAAGAREPGQGVKQGAREDVETAGDSVAKKGKEMQEKAKAAPVTTR